MGVYGKGFQTIGKNYVGVELHQPFPIVWNPFP